MGRLQLGRNFEPADIDLIVAFLKTQTGEQPSFVLPQLPPSTDQTPRPRPFQ
jgi:cytochrome c peroxidase